MELFDVMNRRFSCRKFLDKPVSRDDLDKILKYGMKAPVGRGRYDDMHITVITDTDLLNEISGLTDKSVFYCAKALIIISAKDDGHGLCQENCACVAENMLLTACDLNLGSIYLNLVIGLIRSNKDILSKLNLPDGFVPYVGVGIGYIDGDKMIKKHEISVNYI